MGPPPAESRSKFTFQKIPPAQMEERRKRGLCYNCDEKWHTGHKCKQPKVFVMEGVTQEEKVIKDMNESEVEEEVQYGPELSLNVA